MHIHSVYSDGDGTPDMIIRAGQTAGLDYLIITDHNTLRARSAGYEGWHGKLLVSVGEEVSYTREHCLAIGAKTRINGRQPTHRIIREIEAQGGISIIAHPHSRYQTLFRERSYAWRSWKAPFTGIELWSYMWDWIRHVRYYNFLWRYPNPDAWIEGPDPETLRMWDRLTLSRRVVAVGGLDVHARRRAGGLIVVYPYHRLFRTLLTHVLTPEPFCGEGGADLGLLHRALRSGHCYLSYEALHEGRGFMFSARNAAGDTAIMGDEIRGIAPVDLQITLPAKADARLLKDGVEHARIEGVTQRVSIGAPGVYRVEARLKGRPWLFSNPIYVRPARG